MKKYLLTFVALLTVATIVSAKTPKRPESYNYQRGVQALYDENFDEAVTYLNKEINDNSKNGYAYAWLSAVRANQSEYGKALSNANYALQYLPKADKVYVAWAHRLRADAYLALEDTTKAIADYSAAIKIEPTNEDYYEYRAQVYYELEQYDLSNKDYEQIIKLRPGGVMGHMGIGRNYNAQKLYDEAIKTFTYVISLESEYSSGYSFRAESYYEQGKYAKAIKDVIKALEIDEDRKASWLMHSIADSAFVEMKTQLNIMQKKNPNERKWSMYIANICQTHDDYETAIEYYDAANKIDYVAYSTFRKSECFEKLGRYEDALDAINEALQIDSTYYEYVSQRASLYHRMGYLDLAIADATKNIDAFPEYAGMYNSRAWIEEFGDKKQIEAAIEDYTTAITIQEDISRFYLRRGVCYMRVGHSESLANKDFQKAIEIAIQYKDTATLLFGYAYTNQVEKMTELLPAYKASEDGKKDLYDIACLYALTNQKDSAIYYLDKSLAEQKYMTRFHILNDYDMTNLHNTPELQALLEKYNLKDYGTAPVLSNAQEVAEGGTMLGSVDEIPFTKKGGVYEVKCSINDLPLSFIFDTGASSVSISALEANFMMKNGYLSSKDVVGSQRFVDANGDISEGTIINLKSVKFGNSELTNVKASVVHNQKAPLLLGQTVLNRLGKIEIDYKTSKLKISK